MEEKTKENQQYDVVERCISKLSFISALCDAVCRGGESPNLSEFATEGLGLICTEMREQLSPVAFYLQDQKA